ncbi:MBL fold metallo-hydrolase [Ramlibacter sp. Leaf400]|uniref:MBL fold metallo-hydrolase n=1 Tax=Ramlibacter sp. Leaf400 TaxID=1736365 RepID=UPI0006F347C8|nr:MBL fold metallo-hydrolase [Ramlibacter sp. Leaf400]
MLLSLALAAGALSAQPQAPEVAPQKVSASAWFVQGASALGSPANRNFISNAGFVVTPAGVVVVDALGSPALALQLLEEIRKVTPLPVTHVVLTHYHADHVYGLQAFKAAGAKVLAHRGARDYLASDTARLRLEASRAELAPWIDGSTQLVAPDEWLDGPRDLVVGGVTLRLLPVGPAHTPEDLLVWLPHEKVLFAGDLVFRGRIPFVGQADSRRWVAALDQILGLEAGVVVPGHGPLTRDARADLQLTRDYLVHLRRVMGQAAKNLEPWEEAYRAADWSRFEHLPLFQVANRMNAYNTYLLMEQEKD